MQPANDSTVLELGTYKDARETAPVRIFEQAWEQRRLNSGGQAERVLRSGGSPALRLALAPNRDSFVALRGSPDGAAYQATFRTDGGQVACSLPGILNRPLRIPRECAVGRGHEGLPGAVRDMIVATPSTLAVTTVRVVTDILYVEAEQLRNVVDDGGDEAFYNLGPLDQRVSNDVVMLADARLNRPIELATEVVLPGQSVECWILMRTVPAALLNTRGDVSVFLGDRLVGTSSGVSSQKDVFWKPDVRFEWVRLGEVPTLPRASLRIAVSKRRGRLAGFADIDAVAIIPR